MDTLTKNITLAPMNLLYKISPEITLRILFRLKTGYKLNLDHPVTYNEKLQWIKLYDKNPLMPICADKYAVRNYVESCGCAEILNDLIWEGFDPEEIPFDSLPNRFVIKATHGSGFNIICRNKDELDYKKVVNKLKKWLKQKYFPCYGEWFYGVVKPRIIIERLLTDNDDSIPADYKVMCFHGEPRYILVDTDRFTSHKRNIYTIDWRLLKGVTISFPNGKPIDKPSKLEELLYYSRKLSSKFIHARIDFYIVNNKIYFGEITFTHGAGFSKINPFSFNVEMGSHINLPLKKKSAAGKDKNESCC
ncbi:MAG TPA: ATP-grasp fold amidoligase family protein [Bacillota bacterium]|nr:ATP-grasp fold amidoligase family protein [Bacillota bacterium]